MLSLTILITTVSINLILILFILYKKNKDRSLSLNIFIFSLIFLLLWSVTNYLADNTPVDAALIWTRATFPASLFSIWLITWFSFSFPVKLFNYKYLNIFYLLLVISASLLSMSDKTIKSINLIPGIGVSSVELGHFYPLIILSYFVLIITIVYNLTIKYKRLDGVKKMQVAYVILGWSIFISGGMITNLILPYLTGNADWSKFGPLFSIIMAASTTYAIIRYKFLDIRLVIQQGLVYSLLILLIGGVYFLIASISGFLFSRASGIQYSLSAYLTTLIGVFGVPIIKKAFDRYTDKIFFKEKYDFSEAVYSLSQILNENLNLETLKKEICNKLKKLMKLQYVNIIMNEDINKNPDHKRMSEVLMPIIGKENLIFLDWEIENKLKQVSNQVQINELKNLDLYTKNKQIKLFVMLRIGKKPIGFISIGAKQSKEEFNSDDIKLLRNLGYQMAVAIEKARLYKEIKKYSINLEKKVNERTKTIDELQKDQKQIILDIAHGLQTPITIIKGELGFLQKSKPNNKEFLAFEKSIDRISQLISDLLLLAKLDSKQESENLEKINLSELFYDLAEYFEVVMRNKNIRLQKDIERDIFILGKPDKLEEMINNFVSNSIKYIGSGNIISLGLHKKNNQAVLNIKDDGIGITKEEIPLLTKRFYRAKNNANKGSGLGLAICQKIIDLHRGKLEIRSEGRGTEMIVTFKLIK